MHLFIEHLLCAREMAIKALFTEHLVRASHRAKWKSNKSPIY